MTAPTKPSPLDDPAWRRARAQAAGRASAANRYTPPALVAALVRREAEITAAEIAELKLLITRVAARLRG